MRIFEIYLGVLADPLTISSDNGISCAAFRSPASCAYHAARNWTAPSTFRFSGPSCCAGAGSPCLCAGVFACVVDFRLGFFGSIGRSCTFERCIVDRVFDFLQGAKVFCGCPDYAINFVCEIVRVCAGEIGSKKYRVRVSLWQEECVGLFCCDRK